jgi:hypothetical protein
MKLSAPWKAACIAPWVAGSLAIVEPARAAEYVTGSYLLGAGIPMSGFTPPPGFYLSDTIYAYHGDISGNVKLPFKIHPERQHQGGLSGQSFHRELDH